MRKLLLHVDLALTKTNPSITSIDLSILVTNDTFEKIGINGALGTTYRLSSANWLAFSCQQLQKNTEVSYLITTTQ